MVKRLNEIIVAHDLQICTVNYHIKLSYYKNYSFYLFYVALHYLCVISRDITINSGERNFHVFYYMYDGLEWDGRMKRFHLDSSLRGRHRYLSGDRTDKATKQVNVGRFQQLKEGFKLLGFKEDEVDAVYSILAAILHLGDIEFGEVASNDNTDKSRVIDLAPLHRGNKNCFYISLLKYCRPKVNFVFRSFQNLYINTTFYCWILTFSFNAICSSHFAF